MSLLYAMFVFHTTRILPQYLNCNVWLLCSPTFRLSIIRYIAPINNASMQSLVIPGLVERLGKSCFRCKRDTCRICLKHISHFPKGLVFNVNWFSYINNQFMKIIDQNTRLENFSLQTIIDNHGLPWNCGHYSTSVNRLGKFTECDINST